MKRIIITADDFGLAVAVNEAVEIAHCRGVLNTCSLMVQAPAFRDAVARALRLPTLRVGLHLVLVDGRPSLPVEQVPDLVEKNGEFGSRLLRQGARFFFQPRVRQQLEAEIRAQFESFRLSGLYLDHVNAHKHMHLHPTVLGLILAVGRDYGLKAVRLPYEPMRMGIDWSLSRLIRNAGWALFLSPWMALLRWLLRRAGVMFNDYMYGLAHTGTMDEKTMLRIIDALPEGVSEVYCHPATCPDPDLARAAPGYLYEEEFAALISPRVRSAIETAGIVRISFSELG